MVKKITGTLLSILLFSTANFAADNQPESNQQESTKKANKKDNYGQKHSSEVNKGQQGDKMRKEHANQNATNPDDAKSQGGDQHGQNNMSSEHGQSMSHDTSHGGHKSGH